MYRAALRRWPGFAFARFNLATLLADGAVPFEKRPYDLGDDSMAGLVQRTLAPLKAPLHTVITAKPENLLIMSIGY